MTVQVIHGDALALPVADDSVDLIVTSPPYFGLRSYQDGGEHYAGQIGAEATPAEFVDALVAATREMVRVLKPSGSIFVNLGDKYSQRTALRRSSHQDGLQPHMPETAKDWKASRERGEARMPRENVTDPATGAYVPEKSLMGLPWRYAIRCIDELGLVLRAEIVWSKPNGLPESVTDRVRRSHETWFHFVKSRRYYANIDTIREPLVDTSVHAASRRTRTDSRLDLAGAGRVSTANPLGKLPGSVWTVATQPLRLPPELGVQHFAAFPMEWPRRFIKGWCPSTVCSVCAEPRHERDQAAEIVNGRIRWLGREQCACPDTKAPTTPAVVLDPFGGTGTTATVAHALGRHGITVDLSRDYCRVAEWRTFDPKQLAKARGDK